MKKKRIHVLLVVMLLVVSLTSCEKWLDVEPEGEATTEKLTGTGDGFRSMLGGVYKAMGAANLYGRELQFGIVECLAQEYTWSWLSGSENYGGEMYREAANYNFTDVTLKNVIDDMWKSGYNVIANANNLIQEIEKASPDIFENGEMERKLIAGEAYACRALMHFDLLRLFAPAPVENESGNFLPYVDVYPNIQPDGISVDTYLEKVEADLLKSMELTMEFDTSAYGQSASATASTRFKGDLSYGMAGNVGDEKIDDFFLGRGYRLSYYAAKGVLARVYQYMGRYDEAFTLAKEVLEAKAYGVDGTTVYDMFANEDFSGIIQDKIDDRTDLKLTTNLLFAIYNENAYNDYNLENFFMMNATSIGVGTWLVLDMNNQQMFINPATGDDEREQDYRGFYLLFTPEYSSFWNNEAISAKGYGSSNTTTRENNVKTVPVMRVTELRYIMAETYAREGNFTEAYSILNKIRQNRGLWNNLPVASDWKTFQRDLIRDAQREWISEGQLFYLYKRLGASFYIKGETRKMNKSEYMLPIPENQNM